MSYYFFTRKQGPSNLGLVIKAEDEDDAWFRIASSLFLTDRDTLDDYNIEKVKNLRPDLEIWQRVEIAEGTPIVANRIEIDWR